jgi:hypothetical protein
MEGLSLMGSPYLAETKSPNNMVVISDGDILLNPVSEQEGPLAMGMNNYTRQPFANRDFISNVLFYLTGGQDIIAARSKIFQLRLIDKAKMENDKFFWQILNMTIPLCLLGCFYFINALLRKRKYAYSSLS